ncbi:MAG: hypothetical protein ABII27_01435 [bacterium]
MKKILYALLLFVFVAVGINFLVGMLISKYIKSNVIDRFPMIDGMKLKVRSVSVNPIFAKFSFSGVDVAASSDMVSKSIVTVEKIIIDIEVIPLFVRKMIFEKIIIKSPEIYVESKNDAVIPVPIPIVTKSGLANMLNKITSSTQEYRRAKKYPPPTFENVSLLNGKVKFINLNQTPPGIVVWEKIKLEIPSFWQSLDYTNLEMKYELAASLMDQGGVLEMKGKLEKDFKGITNSGNLYIKTLDLNKFYVFNKKLFKVKNITGVLNLESEINITENMLDIPVLIESENLHLDFYKNQSGMYGIKKDILMPLIEVTNGNIELEFKIEGIIEKPVVNTKRIITQLIQQYLMKSAEQDIKRKASKYGQYLDRQIKKKLK